MDIRIHSARENSKLSKDFFEAQKWVQSFCTSFSFDDFMTLLQLGLRSHDDGHGVYDQIFTLPGNGPIEYQAEALKTNPPLLAKLIELETKTKVLMRGFVKTVDTIAFVPTMLTPNGRVRIPIHSHLSRRNDHHPEKTLTVCWRLSSASQDSARFRFYTPDLKRDDAGLHEDLFSSNAFVEHAVSSPLELFVFGGVDVPHTVMFADAFYMFCVANNVEPLDSSQRLSASNVVDVIR